MTLNRTEVLTAVAEKAGVPKAQADATLTALQEVLVEALRDGTPVRITGLLSLDRVHRAARAGRNPSTGEALDIPARDAVKISAGSALKDAVKG